MPSDQPLNPAAKRQLLERLLREKAVRGVRRVPTSYPQERMWLLNQLEPEGATYNLHYLLRLGGRLDETALEQALTAVVKRHESLRTSFVVQDGVPFQSIDSGRLGEPGKGRRGPAPARPARA